MSVSMTSYISILHRRFQKRCLFLHMGISVLLVFVCIYHMYGSCRPKEGVVSPVTGVMNNCEPPCRCWQSNLGPLEEQPVVLITEPFLQPPLHWFWWPPILFIALWLCINLDPATSVFSLALNLSCILSNSGSDTYKPQPTSLWMLHLVLFCWSLKASQDGSVYNIEISRYF